MKLFSHLLHRLRQKINPNTLTTIYNLLSGEFFETALQCCVGFVLLLLWLWPLITDIAFVPLGLLFDPKATS